MNWYFCYNNHPGAKLGMRDYAQCYVIGPFSSRYAAEKAKKEAKAHGHTEAIYGWVTSRPENEDELEEMVWQ